MKKPSRPPPSPQERGQDAEDLAARYFIERGYSVRARNYKVAVGELDLVVEKGPCVVFVEVRYRRSIAFGTPIDTVNRAKCRKLSLAALQYVSEQRLVDRIIRFDVLSIIKARGAPRIEHVEDAFEVELSGHMLPVLA